MGGREGAKGGGPWCLISLQLLRNKISGHAETVWFWRVIDFHPKWIDAHGDGNNIRAGVCAPSTWREQNVPVLLWCHSVFINVDVCEKNRAVAATVSSFYETKTEYSTLTKPNQTSKTRYHICLIPLYIVYIRFGEAFALQACSMKTSSCKSVRMKLTHSYANVMG